MREQRKSAAACSLPSVARSISNEFKDPMENGSERERLDALKTADGDHL